MSDGAIHSLDQHIDRAPTVPIGIQQCRIMACFCVQLMGAVSGRCAHDVFLRVEKASNLTQLLIFVHPAIDFFGDWYNFAQQTYFL